jgi:hypothetical protein
MRTHSPGSAFAGSADAAWPHSVAAGCKGVVEGKINAAPNSRTSAKPDTLSASISGQAEGCA